MKELAKDTKAAQADFSPVPGKPWIVCFDSDGCVMDTMTDKHRLCFGPCLVQEWGLEAQADKALSHWNSINLYSSSRGVNRFIGLVKALEDLLPPGQEDLSPLRDWVETSPELSQSSLVQAAARTDALILKKALRWSKAVNRAIKALPPEGGGPFPGAVQGVKDCAGWARVAVVSSANREAVQAEWRANGLLECVDDLMTQECGSKAACIGRLAGQGVDPDRVLMVGDAPGDLEAALENGALFYPILAGREAQSWRTFTDEVLPQFREGLYRGTAMERRVVQFQNHLKGERTHGRSES